MKFDVKGLIVAPCTPLKHDGSLNLKVLGRYATYLRQEQHVNNVFVLGTTGEGQNLTVEERKCVAEEWMKQGRSIFDKIIVHVGAGNLTETQNLSIHAASIKADAIAIAPPTYFKPANVQVLSDYIAAVAEVVPDIPVLYYHLPERTGVDLPMLDLLDNVQSRIPNFAGMKYVTYNMPGFGCCQRKYGERYAIAYGKDEMIVFAALMGGTSFVGATFNYMGHSYKEMFDSLSAGNIKEAVKIQENIQEIARIAGGNTKAVTERISGIDLGPSRLPIVQPNREDVDKIMKEINSTGFLKQYLH